MREKTLVTGGTGLLGNAVKNLLPDAVFVSSKDFDLSDPAQAKKMFESIRPKQVLHLAAVVGGVQKNKLHNADMLEKNLLINTHVLNAAREHGVERLISALSACAFPRNDHEVLTEKDLHDGLPFEGNFGYSSAKRMLDTQTRLLNQQYGCRFSTVTPVTMFGPHDNWDLADGHVTASLIHKCFLAKQSGKALEVWGSGEAVRQFVFAEDVARVLVQSLGSFEGPDTVILAADGGISIRTLAEAVAKACQFTGKIQFDPSKPEGQKKRVLQSSIFQKNFKNFKWTPLSEALATTAGWFERHVCVPALQKL